jgi:hypothetical protein
MNTTLQRPRPGHSAGLPRPTIEQDFAQAPVPELVVEHRTIAGFLRIAPHRFHLDEIVRFGKKVGDVAESMQLAYMTTIDSQLGVLRVFPVPLMRRVYDILADQFHWAQFPAELSAIPEEVAAELKAKERLARLLRATMEAAPGPQLQQSSSDVLQWVESEIGRLRNHLELTAGGASATATMSTEINPAEAPQEPVPAAA